MNIDEALIEKVVRAFYAQIQKDALLGPIFAERIQDWEPHLQQMCAFWSSVMLKTRRYDGRPMPKHIALPIDAHHFDRWLELFGQIVDHLCDEEVAATFRTKAATIAKSLEMGVAFSQGASIKNNERYYSERTRNRQG